MITRRAGSRSSPRLDIPATITGPSSSNRSHKGNFMTDRANMFDAEIARARCNAYRRRILDMSQKVSALHIGGAFSCTEIVDLIYNELMRPSLDGGKSPDTFLMSKGHGCMIQYMILVEK